MPALQNTDKSFVPTLCLLFQKIFGASQNVLPHLVLHRACVCINWLPLYSQGQIISLLQNMDAVCFYSTEVTLQFVFRPINKNCSKIWQLSFVSLSTLMQHLDRYFDVHVCSKSILCIWCPPTSFWTSNDYHRWYTQKDINFQASMLILIFKTTSPWIKRFVEAMATRQKIYRGRSNARAFH
jgi:hypothetical protein